MKVLKHLVQGDHVFTVALIFRNIFEVVQIVEMIEIVVCLLDQSISAVNI